MKPRSADSKAHLRGLEAKVGTWNYYCVTDEKSVTLEVLADILQAVSSELYIDADLLVLHDEVEDEEAELGGLEVAQITIEAADFAKVCSEFGMALERNEKRAYWKEALQKARMLIVLQLVNIALWEDNDVSRTPAPLHQALLDNFEGVLLLDDGTFHKSGDSLF